MNFALHCNIFWDKKKAQPSVCIQDVWHYIYHKRSYVCEINFIKSVSCSIEIIFKSLALIYILFLYSIVHHSYISNNLVVIVRKNLHSQNWVGRILSYKYISNPNWIKYELILLWIMNLFKFQFKFTIRWLSLF